VYSIKIPSINKYYIGVSKQKCSHRWRKSMYKGMALEPYLDEWESMEKTVIEDNLTKEEALKKEDVLIQELNDLCINSNRSGWIAKNDKNAYARELYQNNPEYRERKKQLQKQWRENNPYYMKQWRENNKEKMREYDKQHNKSEQQNQLTLFDLAS
jgi:hypothetical protein